jgi:hypothetical protein
MMRNRVSDEDLLHAIKQLRKLDDWLLPDGLQADVKAGKVVGASGKLLKSYGRKMEGIRMDLLWVVHKLEDALTDEAWNDRRRFTEPKHRLHGRTSNEAS